MSKYLRKSNFKYDTNPEVKKFNGEFHPAYITLRHRNKSIINIITHSKSFFGEPTKKLEQNPNRSKYDSRESRFSVPRWEYNHYLKDEPEGYWSMSNKDKKTIHKENKKYFKNGSW